MTSVDALAGIGSTTRALPWKTRAQLAHLLIDGEVDLLSPADVSASLGLRAADAKALSAEFRRLSEHLGAEAARGVVLGLCAGDEAVKPPFLVWTAPGAPAAARRTAQVLDEMVSRAQKRIVVVGYSLTKGATPFLKRLAEAARRGVRCSLIADRMDTKLKTIAQLWPSDVGFPDLWTRPADPGDEMSALHAKFIVVDGQRLLITSANLTYHGFHGNIEMGVVVEGPAAADAERLVREWSKAGLIRRVGAD